MAFHYSFLCLFYTSISLWEKKEKQCRISTISPALSVWVVIAVNIAFVIPFLHLLIHLVIFIRFKVINNG